MDETAALKEGLLTVFHYDNIAIVVLMLIVLLEAALIWTLLKRLFKITDVLNGLKEAITILNERIRHYDDEQHTKRDS